VRKFGVRSAMPSVSAKRQCPDLIFVKPRFEVYKAVSQQIREIFAEHTPIIEPLSLDEAYSPASRKSRSICRRPSTEPNIGNLILEKHTHLAAIKRT
jgi:DNA polymerase IV